MPIQIPLQVSIPALLSRLQTLAGQAHSRGDLAAEEHAAIQSAAEALKSALARVEARLRDDGST